MFGMSGTELAIVLILALLLLGPSKMPELARTLGKAVRDFKRATNDIRGSVESEFYRMDSDPLAPLSETPKPAAPVPAKAEGVVPTSPAPNGVPGVPAPTGMPVLVTSEPSPPSMAQARVEKAPEPPPDAEKKAEQLAADLEVESAKPPSPDPKS